MRGQRAEHIKSNIHLLYYINGLVSLRQPLNHYLDNGAQPLNHYLDNGALDAYRVEMHSKRKRKRKRLNKTANLFVNKIVPSLKNTLRILTRGNYLQAELRIPMTFPDNLTAIPNYNGVRMNNEDITVNESFEEHPNKMVTRLMFNKRKDFPARNNENDSHPTLVKHDTLHFGHVMQEENGAYKYHPIKGALSWPHFDNSSGFYEKISPRSSSDSAGHELLTVLANAAGMDLKEYLDIFHNPLLPSAPKLLNHIWKDAKNNMAEDAISYAIILHNIQDKVRQVRFARMCNALDDGNASKVFFGLHGVERFFKDLNSDAGGYDSSEVRSTMLEWREKIKDSLTMSDAEKYVFDSTRIKVIREIAAKHLQQAACTGGSNIEIAQACIYRVICEELAFLLFKNKSEVKDLTQASIDLANELIAMDSPRSWLAFKVLFNDVYGARSGGQDSSFIPTRDGGFKNRELKSGTSRKPFKTTGRNLALHYSRRVEKQEPEPRQVYLIGTEDMYQLGVKNSDTSLDYRRQCGGVVHVRVLRDAKVGDCVFEHLRLTQPFMDAFMGRVGKLRQDLGRQREWEGEVHVADKKYYKNPLYHDLCAFTGGGIEGMSEGYIPPHADRFGNYSFAYLSDCIVTEDDAALLSKYEKYAAIIPKP